MVEKDVNDKKKVNVMLAIIIEYLWMCLKNQGFEYAMVLNRHSTDIVHSVKSLYKVLNTSWDSGVFRILSDS